MITFPWINQRDRGAVFALAVATVAVSAGSSTLASDRAVELFALDGTASIEGYLVSARDGVYVVQTAIGDMKIDAYSVLCTGASCPFIDDWGQVAAEKVRALLD